MCLDCMFVQKTPLEYKVGLEAVQASAQEGSTNVTEWSTNTFS